MTDAYEVHSLAGLDEASPVEGRVVWDPVRSLWNGGMLVAALALGPLTFSWDSLAVFLGLAAVTLCLGHSIGVHRRLIHRSFECPPWLERILVWLGCAIGIGGPLWTIRLHDSRDWAQRQADCHPILAHKYPFWFDGLIYLHCRLELARPPLFQPRFGIGEDPFYRWLDRTWMLQQVPIALALFAIGGWPWVVWGICVRVAACTTMHWYISYVAHTEGPQDWLVDGAGVQAHNVPLWAIPTMGESWHNNHHAFPDSARHGHYPGQIDIGWHVLKLLERLGLAWDIRLPATLPPRPGLTPVQARALSIAAPGQASYARFSAPRESATGTVPYAHSAD